MVQNVPTITLRGGKPIRSSIAHMQVNKCLKAAAHLLHLRQQRQRRSARTLARTGKTRSTPQQLSELLPLLQRAERVRTAAAPPKKRRSESCARPSCCAEPRQAYRMSLKASVR